MPLGGSLKICGTIHTAEGVPIRALDIP